MDVRDRWLGLRALKSNYAPTPYSRVTSTGSHVGPEHIAQKAADYLRDTHWGTQVPPFDHALPLPYVAPP
eukprot:10258069-Prorocentrum_lima.AAC.1